MTDESRPDLTQVVLQAQILILKQIMIMLEHLFEMHDKTEALHRELSKRVTEE